LLQDVYDSSILLQLIMVAAGERKCLLVYQSCSKHPRDFVLHKTEKCA